MVERKEARKKERKNEGPWLLGSEEQAREARSDVGSEIGS
jgi:hypothetical protein